MDVEILPARKFGISAGANTPDGTFVIGNRTSVSACPVCCNDSDFEPTANDLSATV
jgi:hypothetical protein